MDKNDDQWLGRIAPMPRPIPQGGMPTFTGQTDCRGHWQEPMRVIYDHQLVVFVRGSFTADIGGVHYDCPPGSFLIVPPGRLHATSENRGQAGRRCWVHFDWNYLPPNPATPVETFYPASGKRELYRRAPSYVPSEILHGPLVRPARVLEVFQRLLYLQQRSTHHDGLLARACLLELLIELLGAQVSPGHVAAGEAGLAQRVRAVLEQAVEEGHHEARVAELIAGVGCSYAHLCRVFRRHFGIPPLRYMHTLRVSRARQLLRDTDWKVARVAYQVGYEDPLYFSRLFRKITGQTPSAYVRKVR